MPQSSQVPAELEQAGGLHQQVALVEHWVGRRLGRQGVLMSASILETCSEKGPPNTTGRGPDRLAEERSGSWPFSSSGNPATSGRAKAAISRVFLRFALSVWFRTNRVASRPTSRQVK